GAVFLRVLWLARVAFTSKFEAYKLPPEWVTPRLDNFIEIFQQFDFAHAFLSSIIAAVGSTAISLPLATCMAYAFSRFATGGLPLRFFMLARQKLPPVILVLPIVTLFLKDGPLNT